MLGKFKAHLKENGKEYYVKVIKDNNRTIVENMHRAYQLSNKDVIQIYDLLLEFEDGILYEVERIDFGFGFVTYERTGESYTPEQINEMFKE